MAVLSCRVPSVVFCVPVGVFCVPTVLSFTAVSCFRVLRGHDYRTGM